MDARATTRAPRSSALRCVGSPSSEPDGTAPGVLAHTLGTTFAAGTNLKGAVAGAAWTFLLPTLELGTVVCLGLPSSATLVTLGRLAARVDVVCAPRQRRRAEQRLAELGLAHVVLVDGDEALLRDSPVDLAVLSSPAPAQGVVDAVLSRASVAYADDAQARRSPPERAVALWVAPRSGEVRRAAELADEGTVAFLRDEGAPAGRRRGLRRIVRALTTRPAPRGERRGLLEGVGSGPPEYVRAIAAEAGVDIANCRVGLSAPSEYASRKVVLFLFPGQERAPRWVVKLTRDHRHNRRLHNEWDALVRLRDAGIGDEATLPRPAFVGHHAALALVGQTAVSGVPLRARTDATPECPHAGAALRWLFELGERSVSAAQAPGDAGAALRELMERFCRLYDLSPRERSTLEALVARVDAVSVPTVFQHGDPGTWNVLVSDDGRPIFLDWEAFEPRGIPLWDAFYLARSHAVTVGRARGVADPMRAVRGAYVDEDGPMARALARELDAHCARIGLERSLAVPLFATCWMHRALKEAGRLQPTRLQRGHYAGLLRAVLGNPEAPGLRRIGGA